ncbi:ECF transporter S component [Clostridium sp. MB40-C1]|uniref:ECF transporter S component n=1 Tax=Clostridium sp. MB40-C1 TaxID=3070996 RepID=UPI0027E1BA7B|nr:ECF transporter S component [Clostridium sp. MB40-C1]WMJ79513.1 ECF transporter S component [Clostridium sp. MB40-C1]
MINNNCSREMKNSTKARDIVLIGLLSSLIFVSTLFLNIRLPISVHGGLIHLGSAMVVIIAILFGKNKAALSAALGMSLFDLLTGGAQWAPFTFLIKGSMAYIFGVFAYAKGRKGNSLLWNTIGVFIGGVWMIIGYYIAEVIIYGNWYSPITSIPGMAIQIAAAMIIGLPTAAALKKINIWDSYR